MSVVCPGFVQTQIAQSHRNMPERVRAVTGESEAFLGDAVSFGIPAAEVADAVFDAVSADRLYVLTHADMARGALDQRIALMFGDG